MFLILYLYMYIITVINTYKHLSLLLSKLIYYINMTITTTPNKPEYITDEFKFKHVIEHVDIIQAEAEFIEKYGHLLDDKELISKTSVDYKNKTITIEAKTIRHFHPPKKANKGFIFDLKVAPYLEITSFTEEFNYLGLDVDDFEVYDHRYLVTTSNKLTKQIIEDAKEVIRLENRTQTFTKTYHFDEDKRPSTQDLLNCQLNFITTNKLHEDDITYVGINTNPEDSYEMFNTITISGKQSGKYKTYIESVAAVINSCVIVDRFDSCLESVLKQGSDNVIERVIKYQHPVVDDTLELLEGSVDVTKTLQDNEIITQSIHEEVTSSTNNIEDEVAEFLTDIPSNPIDIMAETEAYENLQKIKDGIAKNDPLVALSLSQDEIQRLKAFLSNNKYPNVIKVNP